MTSLIMIISRKSYFETIITYITKSNMDFNLNNTHFKTNKILIYLMIEFNMSTIKGRMS